MWMISRGVQRHFAVIGVSDFFDYQWHISLSRNRKVGMMLAQKRELVDILNELGHVAEGVYTAREVYQVAQRTGVDMPISNAVYRVLYENLPADKAAEGLLSRQPSNEFYQVEKGED